MAALIDADTDGRFVPVPDRFELHEWDMMRRFAEGLDDADAAESLLRAISGRGAFRCFKDRIHELDIAQRWYDFRLAAFREIALDWGKANGIPLDSETP